MQISWCCSRLYGRLDRFIDKGIVTDLVKPCLQEYTTYQAIRSLEVLTMSVIF